MLVEVQATVIPPCMSYGALSKDADHIRAITTYKWRITLVASNAATKLEATCRASRTCCGRVTSPKLPPQLLY